MLLFTALVGLTAVPFPQQPSSASCAAPFLKVPDGFVLHRDSTATIAGRAFAEGGCQDSGGCSESFGCTSCTYHDPPPPGVSIQEH